MSPVGTQALLYCAGPGSAHLVVSPIFGHRPRAYTPIWQNMLCLPPSQSLPSYFATNPVILQVPCPKLWERELYPSPTHQAWQNFVQQEQYLHLHQYRWAQRLRAGVDAKMLTQVHGSVDSARCNGCGQARSASLVRDAVRRSEVPKCTDCNGVVRPNVVMFGESS